MRTLRYQTDLPASAALLVAEVDATPVPANAFEAEFIARSRMSPARRGEWLRGRAVLRRLASLQCGLDEREISVGSVGERPGFIDADARGLAGWHLSVSHKGRLVAAAMAKRPVGVDIEARHPESVALRAIERACSSSELAAVSEDAWQRETDLVELWCLKESAVKAGLAPTVFALKSHPVIFSGEFERDSWFIRDAKFSRMKTRCARAFRAERLYGAIVIK